MNQRRVLVCQLHPQLKTLVKLESKHKSHIQKNSLENIVDKMSVYCPGVIVCV